MATASKMLEEIYGHLTDEIVTASIAPRWRRQGDPLPFIAYEVQSVEWMFTTLNAGTETAEVVIAFQCFAETVVEAVGLADEVKAALQGSSTINDVTFAATAINYRVSDAVPDDGTGDAERVVTVTATLTVHDEN